jgi:protoporphyrinogen oxidase
MKIGIIGGGLMGMALARRMSAGGHTVSVFERDTQTGGLSTHQDYGPFTWDRFYHVVLPTDLDLTRFLEQLSPGLAQHGIPEVSSAFTARQDQAGADHTLLRPHQ